MITQQKAELQALSPKTWNQPTAEARVGDYIREPFQPIMIVVDKDLLPDGKVWLLVKPVSASCTQEWVVAAEPVIESKQPQPNNDEKKQAAQEVGDTASGATEFEQGYRHGQSDAAERLHPIYRANLHEYATGYIKGYDAILNPPELIQQQGTSQRLQWSVVYDPKWDWYQVWVGDRCLRSKANSFDEGERIAQKYIAAEELRKWHRELVLS